MESREETDCKLDVANFLFVVGVDINQIDFNDATTTRYWSICLDLLCGSSTLLLLWLRFEWHRWRLGYVLLESRLTARSLSDRLGLRLRLGVAKFNVEIIEFVLNERFNIFIGVVFADYHGSLVRNRLAVDGFIDDAINGVAIFGLRNCHDLKCLVYCELIVRRCIRGFVSHR